MEILRIGKHAIKISLNTNEAQEYKVLDSEALDNEEIREAFSRLLLKAKEKVDFSYAGRKIFTEIFPSRDGGCEIYISCISVEAEDAVYKDKNKQPENKKPALSIFDFDNIDNLMLACYRLKEINYQKRSSIYYDIEKKRYFMILEDVYIKDLRYAFLYRKDGLKTGRKYCTFQIRNQKKTSNTEFVICLIALKEDSIKRVSPDVMRAIKSIEHKLEGEFSF